MHRRRRLLRINLLEPHSAHFIGRWGHYSSASSIKMLVRITSKSLDFKYYCANTIGLTNDHWSLLFIHLSHWHECAVELGLKKVPFRHCTVVTAFGAFTNELLSHTGWPLLLDRTAQSYVCFSIFFCVCVCLCPSVNCIMCSDRERRLNQTLKVRNIFGQSLRVFASDFHS